MTINEQTAMMMSQIPEGDEWFQTEKVCPNCKDVYVWECPWWDDAPEYGGAVIGYILSCGNCEYHESF